MITRYENARVFTANGRDADCFVVQDGVFAFVGCKDDAHAAFPGARRVDLAGQFVCPGFNDSHMHLLNLGCMLTQAQLSPVTDSLAHVLCALGRYAQAHPQEAWVLGRGWNQDAFTDVSRYPTREDLDRVCPDRPCLITRACGHVAVANSAALALCGIDAQARAVEGGRIAVDSAGRPTGVLEENAIDLATDAMPAPDKAQIKQRLLLAMQHVNRFGITSVQSDDLATTKAPFETVIDAYLELKAEGRMTVRVTQQCLLPDRRTLDRFLRLGYTTGWGDAWFRIGPLKLIADGSLGARTALLRAPYADAPHTRGLAIYAQEALDDLVGTAHAAGMQVAVHAIGDGAADRVLHAVSRAQQAHPREDARHGIVHAQVLTHEQARRMAALRMHAYIQPIFLDYDATIVRRRLGERADAAYPAASLLGGGVSASGGSDSPVEPPDVLMGIQCAVTRMPVTRRLDAPYLPHEALTPDEALRLFTSCGAYASFEESVKGRIAPRRFADFTVLGEDPRTVEPARIHAIPVRGVYLAGVPV